MKIRTAIDKYKNLINTLIILVKFEPFGEKFENSYEEFMQILLSNISENKDDLLLLYSESIDKYNNEFSVYLKSATEKEKAFFNAGKIMGLCDIIKKSGNYEKSLEKFIQPYLNLKVGDVVYIKYNDILYKTIVTKKRT